MFGRTIQARHLINVSVKLESDLRLLIGFKKSADFSWFVVGVKLKKISKNWANAKFTLQGHEYVISFKT